MIDLDHAEVHRNGDWFAPMSFSDLLELCSKVTVAQMLTRDDFSKRYKNEQAIYLHECLYPLMQAWDSVKIAADVELGGTEQLYSFMLARDLQGDAGMNRQIGVMSPILVGTDGVRRMGKSLGNYIGISEPAYEMMKKFMQLSDDSMRMFFELLTDLPLEDVDRLLQGHPKEAKVALAKMIIGEYHDADQADVAAERWQKEIGGGALPEEIPVVRIPRSVLIDGKSPAAALFRAAGFCNSNGEAIRMIKGKGAKLGEEKTVVEDAREAIAVEDGLLLWFGKKKFGCVEVVDG